MPDYMYGPLETPEHIRLLKVLDPPDAKDEAGIGEAYFNIVVLSLNEAPVYECVSYAWISKKRDRRLCVRDGSEVAVTASLLGALPYLARASDTGYLWIDQLCINKDDLEERSSQISLMSRIYSQAKRLLVWLGPESSNASLVCQLMEQMASRSDWLLKAACGRHALSQWRVWADNEVIEAFFVAEAEKLCFKHLHANEHQRENEHELEIAGVATSYRNAALRVFDLPWFGRAWVLQEAILADSIVFLFGNKQFDWDRLDRPCLFFTRANMFPTRMFHDSSSLVAAGLTPRPLNGIPLGRGRGFFDYIMKRRVQASNCWTSSLAYFLFSIRNQGLAGCRRTSDPRDIIFSLWNHYDMPAYLKPNYNLTTTTVFQLATHAYIEETGDLSVLSLAGGVDNSRHSLGLPTWVPDWTRPCLRRPLIKHHWDKRRRHMRADKVYSPRDFENTASGELAVQGRIMDRLRYVSKIPLESATQAVGARVEDVKIDSEYFGPLLSDDTTRHHIPVFCLKRNDGRKIVLDVYDVQREKVSRLPLTLLSSEENDAVAGADRHGTQLVGDIPMEMTSDENPGQATLIVMLSHPSKMAFRRLAVIDSGGTCLVSASAQVGDAAAIVHG